MSDVGTEIELYDRFDSVLTNVTNSANLAAAQLYDMQRAMNIVNVNMNYQQLSSIINETQQSLQVSVEEQERLNQEVQKGANHAGEFLSKIGKTAGSYMNLQNLGKVLDMSDELTQTTTQLAKINDGAQTTQELTNMVYAAAQDSRTSFYELADAVTCFGDNAGDVFGSSEEVVAFTELMQKQMALDGLDTQESGNAMQQLSEIMGDGVIGDNELNSMLKQSPELIQNMADYLGEPIESIQAMAAEGQLSADLLKAAVFAASDEINTEFEQMPMTWNQIGISMRDTALKVFQPVLQRLSDIANNESFQIFVSGAMEAMTVLADKVLGIFDLVGQIGGFLFDNWSILSPIIWAVIAALSAYLLIAAIVAVINGIVAVSSAIKAAADKMAADVTFVQTAKQNGLNAALAACPLTWIILLIIALIAVIFVVCNAIAKMTGAASSGFGVMTGGVNVVIQFFKNLGLEIANIALGIWKALGACANNIRAAFHNAISDVQSWWYDLLATSLTVVAGICEALNKLPFVEFDYSGITDKANEYAVKSAEAAEDKMAYDSVKEAFEEGISTYETFQDGWAGAAFSAGADWGDGIADKIPKFSLDGLPGDDGLSNPENYPEDWNNYGENYLGDLNGENNNLGGALDNTGITDNIGGALDNTGIADSIGGIADNTSDISESMDISQEDLKYLRDIAEQEAVNRYTTAEIKVEMNNSNNIGSSMDLDGIVDHLATKLSETMGAVAAGAY